MMKRTVLLTGIALVIANAANAQTDQGRFDLGVQAAAVSSQFDATDAGLGGRMSWHPTEFVGVEAELNLYPRQFPGRHPFTRRRVEGLFGVTAGVDIGPVRPFARLRPGFVDIHQSPSPLACIRIYPPPLACVLASGQTLFALDAGGGVELAVTSRTFLRLDLGDRLVKYPGPVFENEPRRIRERSFFDHDFRIGTGIGLRF